MHWQSYAPNFCQPTLVGVSLKIQWLGCDVLQLLAVLFGVNFVTIYSIRWLVQGVEYGAK